jgi:hypothetical protein
MGAGFACQRDPLQRQRRGSQRLRETERQRATRKHLTDSIARRPGIGRGECQLDFMQGAVGVPQLGRAALGDDLQAVMPGAFTQRAQRGKTIFVEIHQRSRIID